MIPRARSRREVLLIYPDQHFEVTQSSMIQHDSGRTKSTGWGPPVTNDYNVGRKKKKKTELAFAKRTQNCGKSSFLGGKPIISRALFNSYVKLPEGIDHFSMIAYIELIIQQNILIMVYTMYISILMKITSIIINIWLVVSTPLKNISQLGWWFSI